MPIPFLLGALGVAAGVVGAGSHLSAKETNEAANKILKQARVIYNKAKNSLEHEKKRAEDCLLRLGNIKINVLDTSIAQFLRTYEKLKHIEVHESIGMVEISNFAIDHEGVLQLRNMSNIYQSALSSSAVGAVTGAMIVLAASGTLSTVTGTLSMAGSALVAGKIGVATSLTGSALSFGAAMTPMAAIAAPVMLFTGISASIKADENLSKANTTYAETEVVVEKMETSKALCKAIAQRSDMFTNLLTDLNEMFLKCTGLLEGVVKKKQGIFGHKTIKVENLSEDELKLIAVTRSLAGAVKAVIDTPIICSDSSVSSESELIYNDIKKKIWCFSEEVYAIGKYDYRVKPVTAKAKNKIVLCDTKEK